MAQQGTRASSPEFAHDGELTAAAFLARGVRQREVDASTLRGATPCTSCTRWELTSGAGNGVRVTNVAVALPPVGHVGELQIDSDKAMAD